MLDYIAEILDGFDKACPKCGGNKSSAAPDIIFRVNKDCEKLNYKKAV